MINDVQFEKIKNDAEAFYHTIDEVFCPYLNETVSFNVKGLKHTKFKKDTVARSHDDQCMRLKHIHLAPRIIEQSRTLQEFKEARTFEERKAHGKREFVLQDTTYYGFIAIVREPQGMKRLKIIVKRVARGKPYFWSIIPFWKNNQGTLRILHNGNLEHD